MFWNLQNKDGTQANSSLRNVFLKSKIHFLGICKVFTKVQIFSDKNQSNCCFNLLRGLLHSSVHESSEKPYGLVVTSKIFFCVFFSVNTIFRLGELMSWFSSITCSYVDLDNHLLKQCLISKTTNEATKTRSLEQKTEE